MINIGIVGAYPPPVGGNSIHIKRLNELVSQKKEFQSFVVDPYGTKKDNDSSASGGNIYKVGPGGVAAVLKASLVIRKINPDIIHFHITAMGRFILAGPIFLLVTPRQTKKILTIHSGSFISSFLKFTSLKRKLAISLIKSFDKIITVNNEIKSFLQDYGCESGDINVIPAFLPPEFIETPELIKVVKQVIQSKKRIILTSGYGIPLYGFEKIIDAFKQDKSLISNYSLIICAYNTYDEDYLFDIEEKLELIPGSLIIKDLSAEEFSYLLKKSALYIRATDRDGDAVAIREANHYALPVVASDVVCRPEYCHLFDREDINSLIIAIQNATDSHNTSSSLSDATVGNFEKIITVL